MKLSSQRVVHQLCVSACYCEELGACSCKKMIIWELLKKGVLNFINVLFLEKCAILDKSAVFG